MYISVSLSILQFAGTPGLGAAHLGGACGGLYLDAEEDVAACARMFRQLKALALGPAKTALPLREQAAA